MIMIIVIIVVVSIITTFTITTFTITTITITTITITTTIDIRLALDAACSIGSSFLTPHTAPHPTPPPDERGFSSWLQVAVHPLLAACVPLLV
jgi:hypothetical protein